MNGVEILSICYGGAMIIKLSGPAGAMKYIVRAPTNEGMIVIPPQPANDAV